jgi:hypothetical protein
MQPEDNWPDNVVHVETDWVIVDRFPDKKASHGVVKYILQHYHPKSSAGGGVMFRKGFHSAGPDFRCSNCDRIAPKRMVTLYNVMK